MVDNTQQPGVYPKTIAGDTRHARGFGKRQGAGSGVLQFVLVDAIGLIRLCSPSTGPIRLAFRRVRTKRVTARPDNDRRMQLPAGCLTEA